MITTTDVIVLDRDGVINEDSDDYIKNPDEWRPIAGSLEAIASLTQAGFRIVVASNQSGVDRGLYSLKDLDAINAKMAAAITAAGGALSGIYYCPHLPNEGCDCRKPATGMLDRARNELGFEWDGALLVGDKSSDLELAHRVGAQPILVLTGYGRKTAAAASSSDIAVFDDLASAVGALLAVRAS